MAYPPKAKALLGRHHQQEHIEILAAMTAPTFSNSDLSDEEIVKRSVTLALEIQKQVAERVNK